MSASWRFLFPPALALLLFAACGDKPEAPQGPKEPGRAETMPGDLRARIRTELIEPLTTALSFKRAGSLEELFVPDSRHGFPMPGAGARSQPAGLSLFLIEASDNSELNTQNLVRQWLAHMAGWSTPPALTWQQLPAPPDAPAEVLRYRLHASASHESGRPVLLELQMTWELEVPEKGPVRIRKLTVDRGLAGTADHPRFVRVGAGVGFAAAISESNRQAMASEGARGTAPTLGITALDWDGDGFEDMLVTREGAYSELLLNDGQSGFVPGLLPLDLPEESARQLLAVDLDGDGLEELVGSRLLASNERPTGLGLYTRSRSGFWSLEPGALVQPPEWRGRSVQSITPVDVDGDGRLDLVLAMAETGPTWDERSQRPDYDRPPAPAVNVVMRNTGDLHFEPIAAQGDWNQATTTHFLAACDYDGDGRPDLYEANAAGQADRLWLGGPGSVFRLAGDWCAQPARLLGEHTFAMPLPLPGGHPQSLLVPGETATGHIWWQQDEAHRAYDMSTALGLYARGSARCVLPLDLGNRGAMDFLVAGERGEYGNVELFIEAGRKSGGYEAVSDLLGLAGLPPMAAGTTCDLDGDGDLDLFLVEETGQYHLFADTGTSGSFLRLRLRSHGQPAPQALLEITGATQLQARCPDRQRGASSQAGGDMHVGLGTSPRLEAVEIRWPDGTRQRFRDLETGRVWELEQQRAEPVALDLARWPEPVGAPQGHPAIGGFARLYNGSIHPLGTPGLVNVVHLTQSVDAAAPWPWPRQLERAGEHLDLTLGVADLDGWVPPDDLPVRVHTLDRAMREDFLGGDEGLALPATFVFGPGGELLRTFQGPVDESTLDAVLRRAAGGPLYPYLAVRRGYRALADRDYAGAREAFSLAISQDAGRVDAYIGLGHTLRYLGNLDGARVAFTNATRSDPQFALPWRLLGDLQRSQGRGEQAMASYRRVIDLEGPSPWVWFAYGETAMDAGRYADGLQAMNEALKSMPAGETQWQALAADTHCARGKLYEHMDRKPEALLAYRSALAIDPRHPEALDCENRLVGRGVQPPGSGSGKQ
ncbi:MAG: FG-GAP-like repeat-containing protein [Planctomycetota bacterium]